MIRTVVIPENETVNLSFSIPKEYIGKELEVIAFSKEEGIQKYKKGREKISFNALAIDTKGFKFNREEANER